MKKRKFIKSHTKQLQLLQRISYLESETKHKRELIKRLFKERNEARESTVKDETEFNIFEICNSYESGFGHGVANDGLDLSKTPHTDEHLGMAYQIGYEAGQYRHKGKK